MPKLSILVPLYNEEDYVGELLERVLRAPLPPGVIAGGDWKHWTDFGCPRCGSPEFSIPAAIGDDNDDD